MKTYSFNFEKFFEETTKFINGEEMELSPEHKRYEEIINHIQREEVTVAGDIDWDSFTLEELNGAFDYLDDMNDMESKIYAIAETIKKFNKKKDNTIIDIF